MTFDNYSKAKWTEELGLFNQSTGKKTWNKESPAI